MLVQDRKTGRWYDPDEKMKELMQMPWFIEQMKRMKDVSFNRGILESFNYSLQEATNKQG
jgi:hypothetical protein